MKKFLYLVLLAFLALGTSACTDTKLIGMQNPWTECAMNMHCASKIAGFNFPLTLSNYTVRAMKGVFEVTYPLDEFREVTVRKGMDEENGLDNSGDYTKYEHNKVLTLKNGVEINIRGNGDKINVMYFAAESGVFSARCAQGMTKEEVEGIYKVIAEAETSKYTH